MFNEQLPECLSEFSTILSTISNNAPKEMEAFLLLISTTAKNGLSDLNKLINTLNELINNKQDISPKKIPKMLEQIINELSKDEQEKLKRKNKKEKKLLEDYGQKIGSTTAMLNMFEQTGHEDWASLAKYRLNLLKKKAVESLE
tara:strand:- start:208 stop:639 length:432 start_codon:yes stop_codon:yes gene_type:complete